MPLNPDSELARLMAALPQVGKVEWSGLIGSGGLRIGDEVAAL